MTLPPLPQPSSNSEVSTPESHQPFLGRSGDRSPGNPSVRVSRALIASFRHPTPALGQGVHLAAAPPPVSAGDGGPGRGPGSAAPGGQRAAVRSHSSRLPGRSPPPRPRAFFSLYHKYINYANYGHCILTKSETSPARPPPPPCKALPAPDPATHRSPKPSLPLPGCPAATV